MLPLEQISFTWHWVGCWSTFKKIGFRCKNLLHLLFLNLKLQNQYWHIYCEGQDQNEEALEKIMTEEKSLFQPLQVDPEILEELVGSDVEKKVHNRGCFPKFANDKWPF